MQLAKLSLIIYFKLSSGYSSELFKYKDNAPLAMSIDPEPDVNDDPFASQNDRTGKSIQSSDSVEVDMSISNSSGMSVSDLEYSDLSGSGVSFGTDMQSSPLEDLSGSISLDQGNSCNMETNSNTHQPVPQVTLDERQQAAAQLLFPGAPIEMNNARSENSNSNRSHPDPTEDLTKLSSDSEVAQVETSPESTIFPSLGSFQASNPIEPSQTSDPPEESQQLVPAEVSGDLHSSEAVEPSQPSELSEESQDLSQPESKTEHVDSFEPSKSVEASIPSETSQLESKTEYFDSSQPSQSVEASKPREPSEEEQSKSLAAYPSDSTEALQNLEPRKLSNPSESCKTSQASEPTGHSTDANNTMGTSVAMSFDSDTEEWSEADENNSIYDKNPGKNGQSLEKPTRNLFQFAQDKFYQAASIANEYARYRLYPEAEDRSVSTPSCFAIDEFVEMPFSLQGVLSGTPDHSSDATFESAETPRHETIVSIGLEKESGGASSFETRKPIESESVEPNLTRSIMEDEIDSTQPSLSTSQTIEQTNLTPTITESDQLEGSPNSIVDELRKPLNHAFQSFASKAAAVKGNLPSSTKIFEKASNVWNGIKEMGSNSTLKMPEFVANRSKSQFFPEIISDTAYPMPEFVANPSGSQCIPDIISETTNPMPDIVGYGPNMDQTYSEKSSATQSAEILEMLPQNDKDSTLDSFEHPNEVMDSLKPVHEPSAAHISDLNVVQETGHAGKLKSYAGTIYDKIVGRTSNNPKVVKKLFEKAENISKLEFSTPYECPMEALKAMPTDGFKSAHPSVLANFKSKPEPAEVEGVKNYFSSDLGKAVVANIGADQKQSSMSACEGLGNLFEYFSEDVLQAIRPDCLLLVKPKDFHNLSNDMAASFNIKAYETMMADQVKEIVPEAFGALKEKHLKALSDAVAGLPDHLLPLSGCAGITRDQLANRKSFDGISLRCIQCMPVADVLYLPKETFTKLPKAYFSSLKASAFKQTEDPRATQVQLFSKASTEQLKAIPKTFKEEEDNPFFGLDMDWGELFGGHRKAVLKELSLQSFAVLSRNTIRSMPSGYFNHLNDSIKSFIDADLFKLIPIDALKAADIVDLVFKNSKLIKAFTSDHIQLLLDSKDSMMRMPAVFFRKLSPENWVMVMENAKALPLKVLSLEKGNHLEDLSWLRNSETALSERHWHNICAGSKKDHPCASISYEHVRAGSKATNIFWKGIPPSCITSLQFLDDLKRPEAILIPHHTLANVPQDLRQLILKKRVPRKNMKPEKAEASTLFDVTGMTAEIIQSMSEEELVSLTPSKFAEIPLDILNELDESMAKKLPKNFLNSCGPAQIGALSPELISALTAEQLNAIRSKACSGFNSSQAASLPLHLLSKSQFINLDPSVFSSITEDQLEKLPDNIWRSSISKEQVSFISPETLATFKRFQELGSNYDPLNKHHPCLGIGKQHLKAMSDDTKVAFKRQCQALFDSQDLDQKLQKKDIL